eukprot:COSAG02_NODE_60873_length_270_cov_0.602339_1_plen_57_part_10
MASHLIAVYIFCLQVDCLCRSKGGLGTSKLLANSSSCGCANPLPDGTTDTDCNFLHL